MSVIEKLKHLNQNTAAAVAIFFLSFIGPGFLILYVFKPHLIDSLDTVKILIFSGALSAPSFIVPFFVSVIIDVVLSGMGKMQRGQYGNYAEWYFKHGITNCFNLYLTIFISYFGNFRFSTFCWIMAILLFIMIIIEFWSMIDLIRHPERKISIFQDENR